MEIKRKKRRRPPRKVLRKPTADELMSEAEFRRWRYHAPTSLKRKAYEYVRDQLGKRLGPALSWTERV
jgi:hypothetical protein